MNKPTFVIAAPVDTHSGYGAKSRDIISAIIDMDKYDVKVLPQKWGSTPNGYLQEGNPKHDKIISRIVPNITSKPAIWAQITIPNEFQRIGEYNILFTSGIETDLCSAEFIEGCNRADLVVVPSKFTKNTLLSSAFERREKGTDKVMGKIQVTSPVAVLMEGLDTDVFKLEPNKSSMLDEIPEDFCFLFTSHWLNGELGEDRKDVGGLIKTFLETFKDKPIKPALILKTSAGNYSIMDRDLIISRINDVKKLVKGDLPNVYLIHGDLSEEEVNELNNHQKVKAFVSFTKGEGWGRCLLEQSICQKPMIVSDWSGHLDFLPFALKLKGTLRPVHKSATNNLILAESKWFTVDYGQAKSTLLSVYKGLDAYVGMAKRQSYHSRINFNLEKMATDLQSILETNIKTTTAEFVMPQLKKIS